MVAWRNDVGWRGDTNDPREQLIRIWEQNKDDLPIGFKFGELIAITRLSPTSESAFPLPSRQYANDRRQKAKRDLDKLPIQIFDEALKKRFVPNRFIDKLYEVANTNMKKDTQYRQTDDDDDDDSSKGGEDYDFSVDGGNGGDDEAGESGRDGNPDSSVDALTKYIGENLSVDKPLVLYPSRVGKVVWGLTISASDNYHCGGWSVSWVKGKLSDDGTVRLDGLHLQYRMEGVQDESLYSLSFVKDLSLADGGHTVLQFVRPAVPSDRLYDMEEYNECVGDDEAERNISNEHWKWKGQGDNRFSNEDQKLRSERSAGLQDTLKQDYTMPNDGSMEKPKSRKVKTLLALPLHLGAQLVSTNKNWQGETSDKPPRDDTYVKLSTQPIAYYNHVDGDANSYNGWNKYLSAEIQVEVNVQNLLTTTKSPQPTKQESKIRRQKARAANNGTV